jgi:tRNA G18 (ribose-2'-O)-methylase SpoU
MKIPSDARNVIDEFKGMNESDIIDELDSRGVQLEIAIENTLRDFNMGSIVRSANAFGVRKVHVVGRRQWNKRGAMMTDKYLHVLYHNTLASLRAYADTNSYEIIAVDNVPGSVLLQNVSKNPRSILLFGQEGPGLSHEALAIAERVVAIEQLGSTRSMNVAAAAAVAMYVWSRNTIVDTAS